MKMWNASKSVKLSYVCTKIAIILVICFTIATPDLVTRYAVYTGKDPSIINSLYMTIYACIVPAILSLICLDRLIYNIRRAEVFVEKNVKLLRALSWCSFAFSLILFISGYYYILFLMLAISGAFLGLILRVIKNVFEQAIIIKSENDLTI